MQFHLQRIRLRLYFGVLVFERLHTRQRLGTALFERAFGFDEPTLFGPALQRQRDAALQRNQFGLQRLLFGGESGVFGAQSDE